MSEAARVLDLFAGPGGWDCAATELGLDPLGIEYDDNACATRKAAGLRTLQAARRPIDAPAPTVMFGHKKNEVSWTRERPATTVTADPDNSIPVTVEQAAALQSFPPDHPWQGSKTKQHEQVGNAVPPLMARVILEALRLHTPKESE